MKTPFWHRWRPVFRADRQGRPVSRRGRRPLQVEQLEDRALLSAPRLLADINPGSPSSNPTSLVVIGSEAYFVANDGTHGDELWKTDGTAAGTTMVADINPGANGSKPRYLTNVNGELFFTANDGTHGNQLWKSDGTATGTVMVTDINPAGGGPYFHNLTNVNGTLFFAGYAQQEYGLWKSDGTAAGTVQVSTAVSSPGDLTNVNGELYFSGYSTDGDQLWKSDGTAAGTVEVKDIYPGVYFGGYFGGPYPNNSNPHFLTNVNGTLFFAATDANGTELWKSDGTAAGTISLTGNLNPSGVINVNGTLYFTAGETLWKSDGTAAGTVEVAGFTSINDIINVNGELYFAADDGTHGTQLWKSDGTAAGTTLVKDINPGTSTTMYYTGYYGTYTRSVVLDNANPGGLTNVNGTLYFAADDGTHGKELWQSDGTAAGTTLVQDIYPGSSWQTFNTYGPYGGLETGRAYLPNSSNPSPLANLNGTLLFAANDGLHGNELWDVPAGPSLAVTATSATPTAGVADTFTITALNADGTPDTALNDTVNITVSDGKASYPTRVTLTKGTAQFNVTFITAGLQSVSATDVQNPSDNGSDSDIVVQAAEASSLALTGFPVPATIGVAGTFNVTAYDKYGNVATGYSGTVHFSSSDPNAILPANATLTNGTGQFSATLETLGTNQSLAATDTQDPTLTARQSGIEVLPNASISGPDAGYIGQTLTYTLGAGADPAGTVFTVNWGDGTSTRTTATTVTHAYPSSNNNYSITVTATADGLTSNPVTKLVDILPVTATVEADPALPGTEMLVVALVPNSNNWQILALAGDKSGVSLSYEGIALGTIAPTNKATFALVEVFGEANDVTLDARGLSVSSVLIGGPGGCDLDGGSGRNLLIAGTGPGYLVAGSAGDILIGGITRYDSNTLADQTALAYIMAEWDSADSYATRIKKLQYVGGLNGKYVLNSTTVFNNSVTDQLFGYLQASGSSLDWFFAHQARTNGDEVYGLVSGEVVTRI